MRNRRSIAFIALLTAVLSACQAAPSPIPTRSPAATTAAATETSCAALHWYDVRQALEATDHYTYRSVDHIVSDPLIVMGPGASPSVLERTAIGAYQAPDRMSEVSEWRVVSDAADWSNVAVDYHDFIQIGTQGWERVPLVEPEWHTGLRMPDQRGGHVRSLLMTLAATAPWSAGRLDPAVPTECVFVDNSVRAADGTRFEASLWADPATALPTRLRVHRVGRTGNVSYFDMAIDTAAEATIEPPAGSDLAGSPNP